VKHFDDGIIGFSAYADATDEKLGLSKTFYLMRQQVSSGMLVDLGLDFWQENLLPIGLSCINFNDERVYAKGLTKEQAKNLPEFNDDLKIDLRLRSGKRYLLHSGYWYFVNPVAPVAPFDPMGLNALPL